ncbi:MAG: phosphatidate cytidylyltransferase [Bacteroidales bacterium]|nr:phosphatidate cytidylyltransferase [Bacteroidales bacterium]
MNNFWARTLTSVVFVAVMVSGLVLHPYAFGALFLVIMVVSMQEFYAMSLQGRYRLQQRLAFLTAALFLTLSLLYCNRDISGMWIAVGLVPQLLIPVTAVFTQDHPNFGLLAYIYAALVYIALPMCLSPYLVYLHGTFNGRLLLGLFIIIWACDVGAYVIGTAFGQRPGAKRLAPKISPKKSWWGFWGGIVFGMAAAALLSCSGCFEFPLWHSVALGLLISVSGVCGDLFSSMWKRWFGVKDSGHCIPGHGGMLDRFDSSLIAIPFAVIYLTVFRLL